MFTENQVRQFYVATGTGSDVIAPTKIVTGTSGTYPTDLSAKSAGACQFVITPTGDELYLNYKGPSSDGVQRSDIIKKCNVIDVRCTAAADLKHVAKKAIITLDTTLVSSSNLTTTGDYILNVDIHNYVAMDYNSTKTKFGAAHGVVGDSASSLYKNLALSLAKNFGREPVELVNIYLCKTDLTSPTSTSAKFIKVTDKTAASSLTDTYLGICIEEAAQPWRRGAAKQEFVDFSVMPGTIYASGKDVVWGKVQFYGQSKYTDGTSSATTIGAPNSFVNSKGVADMEWFFHKERGDRYTEMGWPNNVDTTYQVDPSNAYGYTFIDIHYFTEGNSHNIGKSEKTLTVVVPGKASDPEEYAQKLIGAAATTGDDPTPATGLYLFLENTGVNIKISPNWDAS